MNGFNKPFYFVRVVVDMILNCQFDAFLLGDRCRFFKPGGQLCQLWFVRLKPKHQAAADHPHDRSPKSDSMVNVLNHFMLRLLIASRFQTIRMTPRVDSIKTVIIEFPPLTFEVGGAEFRKKTGLQAHTIAPQLLCPVQEGVHGVGSGRRLLVWVDLAEKPMVAVAVDANFHERMRFSIVTGCFNYLIFLPSSGRLRGHSWAGSSVFSGASGGAKKPKSIYGISKGPYLRFESSFA